jgi:hypothetical protein
MILHIQLLMVLLVMVLALQLCLPQMMMAKW